MSKDYYQILNVRKRASEEDIKKAYKILAVKWHPDKNPTNLEEAKQNFLDVTEAFQVLSNPQKRAIYDIMGYGGVQTNSPTTLTESQAESIFNSMFSNGSPGFQLDDNNFKPQLDNGYFSGPDLFMNRNSRKDPPDYRDLVVPLKDFYYGSTHSIKIERKDYQDNYNREVNGSGQVYSTVFNITVSPNMEENKEIVFENMGDIHVNRIPADVIYRIKSKPHGCFQREGTKLLYKQPLSFEDMLSGVMVRVLSIDESEVWFEGYIGGIVNPNYRVVIPEKGFVMPSTQKNILPKRDDLIITFDTSHWGIPSLPWSLDLCNMMETHISKQKLEFQNKTVEVNNNRVHSVEVNSVEVLSVEVNSIEINDDEKSNDGGGEQ